jgi:hypothetical protein
MTASQMIDVAFVVCLGGLLLTYVLDAVAFIFIHVSIWWISRTDPERAEGHRRYYRYMRDRR